MRKTFIPKLNNRGASLIIVIISFVFIIVLCSIVISAAITNVQMKTINKKSKQTFYSAEHALDEVKVRISESVATSMAAAYQKVLANFSGSTETARKSLLESTFVDKMKEQLDVTGGNLIRCTELNSYLAETKLDALTGNGAVVRSSDNTDYLRLVENAGVSLTIQGVKIVYSNKGFNTSVTTDIKIMFPSASFVSPIGVVESSPYINYSLIAAKGLWVEHNSHVVKGSVSVGNEGINIIGDGNSLAIINGRVVSAGDITVKDKASLIINRDTDVDNNEVWANNLVTSQQRKADTPSLPTQIDITGNTYIKDDLIINAYNSQVNLAGEYYGFSSGDGPENNSAIIINMANAFLKMDLLTKLTLSGRAYLKTSSSSVGYVENTNLDGVVIGSNKDILTGESLTVKGSQTAYLLPSEYIAVGHNPVSWEEYKSYHSSGTPMYNISSSDVIFSNPSIYENERKLSDYVDISDPVNCVFYKFGNDYANVVYYYLKFKSEKLATIYFKNYSICYPDRVYNGFPINKILVNTTAGTYITAGNMITYNTKPQVLKGNNQEYINDYARQFNNLTHTLQKNVPSDKELIKNLVKVDKVRADGIVNGGGQAKLITNGVLSDGTQYYVNIFDGDFVFDVLGKQGIIVATGDVKLNTSFTGMVISGGKITLDGGANFTAAPGLIKNILMENPDVSEYFVDLSATSGTFEDWNAIDISQLILYDNWSKN